MTDQEMTVVEHLTELRKRIMWVLAVFIVALIAGFFLAGPLIEYLKQEPIADGVPIISLHPSDALRVYMQFAFLIGIVAVLPVALYHIWRFVSPGLRSEYFGFLFNMVIPFGVLFQLPIIVMFLTRLRILNPMRLAKMRRFAYFGLAVVGITLTPPEIVSDILVTIPLLLLYELSIWLSRVVYRKQLKEQEAWESEYGYDTDEAVR
jgi:sec-independent protein translocase protein TatC